MGLVIFNPHVGQVIGEDRSGGDFFRFDQVEFSKFFIGHMMVDIDIRLAESSQRSSPFV